MVTEPVGRCESEERFTQPRTISAVTGPRTGTEADGPVGLDNTKMNDVMAVEYGDISRLA